MISNTVSQYRTPLLLAATPGMMLFGMSVFAADPDVLPSPSVLIVPIIIIMILVALNGLFVAAEFALVGVRPTRIDQLAEEGNATAAKIAGILDSRENKDRYIATAQLGITIASLGLGMYGEPQIGHFIEPYLARILDVDPNTAWIHTAGYLIALSMLTYLHVVIGEMIPKSLALSSADKTVLWVNGPMTVAGFILGIPVRILNAIGNMLLRVAGVPPASGADRLHSTEELELLVSESAESGMLNEEEEEMLLNIFDFGDRQVNQVMTPRPKIQAISYDAAIEDIFDIVVKSKHSRFPVYENNLDHIVGVVHFKDFVKLHLDGVQNYQIAELLKPLPVVPENHKIEEMLEEFQKQHLHMAIVLDEFGGTAGIVTLEDLVEEIVGEIRDEFDREREPMVKLGPGIIEVDGDYLIDDLKDDVYVGSDKELPDVETVGGLIVTGLGRPPKLNDVYETNGVTFKVLSVDGLAIARARIEFPAPDSAPAEKEDSHGH